MSKIGLHNFFLKSKINITEGYTQLNLEQCKTLKANHHVYLTDDGRISIAGLNTKNVALVAKAFHEVTK